MAIADETENVAPAANDIDKTMDVPTKSLDSPSNVAEKFKCSFCSKCYSKYSHFYHHQRSHKSGRPFVCSLCGTRFPRKGALLKHRLSHTGGKPFKCDVCDKRFVLPKYLADHMQYHTGKKNIACSICDKRFRGKVDLQRHKLIHTVNEPIACGICRRPFDTRDAMVNHRMKEHPTTCQIQNMNLSTANGSTSIDSNNREVSTGHELNGFNEASADETYPNALDILIRSVNLSIYPPINEDMVEKEVELSQTDKESSDIVGQEPEQVVANGNESIDSSQNSQDCESTVKERIAPAVNEYKRKLRDRSSLIEKKADVQSFLEQDSESESSDSGSSEEDYSDSEYEDITDNTAPCDNDDNNTSGDADSVLPSSSIKGAEIAISSPTSIDSQKAKKASRSMKIDSSTSTKLFQCDICEKTFNRKVYLRSHEITHTGHVRRHSGEKNFACSTCDKRFNTSSQLRRHERSHSGVKRLSCSICEMRFGRKSDFNRHQKLHTGGYSFSCPICDKSCNRKDNLLGHVRRHSGEKNFACSTCDKRFNTSSQLRRHERSHSVVKKRCQCSTCEKGFSRKYTLERHTIERHTLIRTGSLANVSTSIDSSILVDSTEKESNASDGNNTNISTGDDLAPTRSPTSAIHSSLIKKEVKKDPKRKTILKEESSNKVHIKAEPKKSRKKDAEMKPAFTELVVNEDDIPVDEDTSEYMEDSSEYMEDSICFKLDQNAESLSNEFSDTSEYIEDSSEYMEDSFSFNSDQNAESSSKQPVAFSPQVSISCKIEFAEEDGRNEHIRDTHSVSEVVVQSKNTEMKSAHIEEESFLAKVTIETASENIKEASVESNVVTATDRNCASSSKDDGVDASQIGLEPSLPTNIPNLEPEYVNSQIVCYKMDSIEEEVEQIASGSASNDFNNLVHPTNKESNASSGTIANISTGDDLSPNMISNNAAHSYSINEGVKKDLKRKTIPREDSCDKVHLEPEQKKSRKTDAQMEPTSTELVDNEDDIPVEEDTFEYMEDSSEYMENSISFKLDQNPESSSNEPVVISPYVCISCKMEFVEEDGLDEHNRDTHTVSEHTDTRTEDIDKKTADLEQKPSLANDTVQTGSEEIEEASVECNAVTATDRNCLSVSKEDGVDASQIASELSLPTNIPNLEPDPPVKGQKIRYKKGSIEEEIERMATAHPDNLYLVWSEKFSLDLALAVANNKPNCVLIVKNFSSNSMVGVTNMVETFSTSVVKIEPDPYSLRFFLFGRMVLPDKIRDNGRFKSVGKLESTMRKFIQAQGKKLVNVLKFSPGVNGWFETLKRDLKEDLVITDTL